LANRLNDLVWRSGLAAALLLAAAPVAAQDNATEPPPPAPAENIGPRELSNFSLNGTVTRPAAPQPSQQPPATAVREPSTRTAKPPGDAAERPAPARPAEAPRTQSEEGAAIDPIPGRPSTAAAAAAAGSTPGFASPISSPSQPIEAASGFSPLPWIAALLLLGAGAVVYFGRRQRRGRYAAAGVSEYLGEQPQTVPVPTPRTRQPAPKPLARAPAPQPTPNGPAGTVTSSLRTAPAPPPGLVTSSLRPWIELELEPSQAMVTDEHAAIAFDVTLFNSGSAPARDVAVEACLINAGQQQDVQLSQFYTSPGEVRDKIPAVAPMARITLKSAVRLPRSAVQEYEVEGRKLFMPMVAVNSRYRWSSGEGQSAASFLVGRAANDSDKLAPLRLDQGKRGWKGLAARRYEKGIRR